MTDPWANVRELFVFEAPIDSDDDEQQLFRSLLTDADALLTVLPLINEAVDAYELPIDVEATLRDWLAALPEHLKE